MSRTSGFGGLRSVGPPSERWFTRTFAVAVIAHLVGNAPAQRGFDGSNEMAAVSMILGVTALVLLVNPDRVVLLATAVLVLVSAWFEAPFLSNHWLVMSFIAVAVIVSLASADPWPRLAVTGRWILLVFYCFAAFAKYNTGFLDPTASCGLFYANQSLTSFGLPTVPSDDPMAWLTVIGPIATESMVPILLAFTRTRRAGVLLALSFHTVIALDLGQNFYDFTSVLIVLLCLFLPEATTADLEERAARKSLLFGVAVVVATVTVAGAMVPQSLAVRTVTEFNVLPFLVWVPFAGWLIFRVARGGIGRVPLPMRLPGPIAWVLVAVVFANGLTPYLELKTGYGFNMYANLSTVAGETNHLVVRRTAHLSHVQDDLLAVVRSDQPDLQAYADRGYLVPERNLLDYLAQHPTTTVVVRDGEGRERTLDGSDGRSMPLLVRKFQLFRAVDPRDPPECQANWLPAR